MILCEDIDKPVLIDMMDCFPQECNDEGQNVVSMKNEGQSAMLAEMLNASCSVNQTLEFIGTFTLSAAPRPSGNAVALATGMGLAFASFLVLF